MNEGSEKIGKNIIVNFNLGSSMINKPAMANMAPDAPITCEFEVIIVAILVSVKSKLNMIVRRPAEIPDSR